MILPTLASAWQSCSVFWPCGLLLFSVAFVSLGAETPAKTSFDIPSDWAENALKRFSEQSGVEVLFPTDAVAGVRTNAIKGEMIPRAALEAMLSGTGLAAVQGKSTGSLTVRKEPDAEKKAPRAAQIRGGARPMGHDTPKPL